MPLIRIVTGFCLALLALTAQAAEFVFADREAGIAVLTGDDAYFAAIGPADVALRLKSESPLPIKALKRAYRDGVREWQDADIGPLKAVIAKYDYALEALAGWLPERVLLVKVTEQVEGGLPHTRANAIILPEASLSADAERLERLFFHELFHVLSRANRDRRDSLYGLIGFKRCTNTSVPPSLAERRVTNPDAPANRHYLEAEYKDEAIGLIPYLHAVSTTYDPQIGDSFGSHFRFGLLVVDAGGNCTARTENGEAVLVSPEDVPAFFEQIGRNTNYVIHPEEILASNFVYLMTGAPKELPNPEIVERLGAFLGLARSLAE